MILAGNRHELLARFLGGGVERDGQFGANGLAAQFFDFGNDAGGRNGDAAGRQAEAGGVEQNARGLDHVRQIQKRLALAHHHDIQAPAILPQAVFARHQQHLADDFTGGEAALQAKQRGHAELAIHRAADLAGDADGVAFPLRHQDGFHGPAVVEAQQVAARAVGRIVAGRDFRQAEAVTGAQFVAHFGRQGRNLDQLGGLAAIDSLVELPGAVWRLIGTDGLAEIGKVHAHQR